MTPSSLTFSRSVAIRSFIIFTTRSKSGRSSALKLQQLFARFAHSYGHPLSNVGLKSSVTFRLNQWMAVTFVHTLVFASQS